MNNGIRRGGGAPPAPPAQKIGQHQNQQAIQAFVAQWEKTEGLGGQASALVAATKLPAVQNVSATITIFRLMNGVETQVGSPINATVVAGTLRSRWFVQPNQDAGAYHFRVTVRVAGNTYTGRTTAALNVRTDGFMR